MKIKDLKNKTIRNINLRKHSKYDDECYLDIDFTDGTSICIVSDYRNWTSKSVGEYPRIIRFKEKGFEDK
jgi:hypothetical protein